MIGTIIVFIFIPIIALFINAVEEHNRGIPFDESYIRSGVPVITLTNNGNQFNFLADTGANMCIINAPYLKEFDYTELEGDGTIYGMEGNVQKVSYAKIVLSYEGDEFVSKFQVVDVGAAFDRISNDYGIVVHGVLGSDFFEEHKINIDFIEHEVSYGQIKT